MRFNDKELDLILSRKIDKIIFESNGQKVLVVDLEGLLKKRLETDGDLKKQLLTQVLQSED